MKKKLQWLGKLFFLSIAILFWVGCENDEVDSRPDSGSQITKRIITLGELRQKTSDYEKLQTIEHKIESNRQSVDGRMQYDSLYGFYIDTEKILLIEKADYYSYTIPIKRNAENGKVENLVLSFDADGTFKSYLTAYSLTAEEKNQLSEGEKVANLETKTSIAALSDNAASSGGSGGGIFHDANGNCFVINHIWTDQSGTLAWSYVQIDCPADSGGGDAGGSNPGSDTGSNPGGWPGNYPDPGGYQNPGGGGTGENGGEVITEPILPDMTETPCAKLKKLISISGGPNLKATIANVKANVDGYCEHGAIFKKNGTNYSVENLAPVNSGSNADGTMPMKPVAGVYGGIHTHPKICYGMFSFADLYAAYQIAKNGGAGLMQESVFMLAVENPLFPNQPSKNSLFALKIENFSAFEGLIAQMFGAAEATGDLTSYTDEQRKSFIDKIDENLSALYKQDMGNLDRVLLRFIANGGGGASLYQANDEITNWAKISLNATAPNNGPVTKQPCN